MTKSFATMASAAALALGLWMTPEAQGQPMYDRIHVNLPYSITLGDKTLQPGDYTIQQLPDQGGGSRVLLFYTNDGMKFETSAMTIPALDPNTARDTKVILNHVGDDYYIDKIWVQGKDYGYQIPVPRSLKEREREKMTQTTVAGTYQPSNETNTTASTSTTTHTETAATTPPPVTSQTPATEPEHPVAPPASAETQPMPKTQPETSANNNQANNNNNNEANRSMADQNTNPTPAPAMPHTAANWLLMLLSGGTLSGAGMMLRRKR